MSKLNIRSGPVFFRHSVDAQATNSYTS